MHGVKPLHMRKAKVHSCKIRRLRNAKGWTLVESDYDLGTVIRASHRAAA
jgi:hypothetical protein